MSDKITEKISKARTHIILDHPFFGSMIMRLKMVEDEFCPTMGTDGKKIIYNPAFVEAITIEELKGVIAHEILHVGFGHHARQQSREHKKWNVACDFPINHILESSGFQLPKGALRDDNYGKMSAEEVYSKLPKNQQDKGQGGKSQSGEGEGNGQGGGGYDMPEWGTVDKYDGHDAEAEVQRWKVQMSQAAKVAKAQGKLPASLERFVVEYLEPEVDWKTVLHDFVSRVAQNDYNWSRPNRRYASTGFILPSLHNLEMGDITVAIDTSGSISEKELTVFASELNGIMDTHKVTVNVLYADAEVNAVDQFTSGDTLEFRAVGGGGTDFRPAFEYNNDHFEDCACFIYFTDMWGAFPDNPPEYPVLWIDVDGSMDAPWGTHIKYKEVVDAA